MTVNALMEQQGITKYHLSKSSGVPYKGAGCSHGKLAGALHCAS